MQLKRISDIKELKKYDIVVYGEMGNFYVGIYLGIDKTTIRTAYYKRGYDLRNYDCKCAVLPIRELILEKPKLSLFDNIFIRVVPFGYLYDLYKRLKRSLNDTDIETEIKRIEESAILELVNKQVFAPYELFMDYNYMYKLGMSLENLDILQLNTMLKYAEFSNYVSEIIE